MELGLLRKLIMTARYNIFKQTAGMIWDSLSAENTFEFYHWLNKYDDFAGKDVIQTIEDLVFRDWPSQEQLEASLTELKKIINERLVEFANERGIDLREEFLNAKRECITGL